jgi:two-component system sensor kinase FixL
MPFIPEDDPRQILAAIVESSDDAIIAKDLDGIVLTWNRGASRMYGYAPEEMIGRPVAAIIPEERLAEYRDILKRVAAGERIAQLETTRVAKDGRRVEVSLTVSPMRDGGGQVIGASTIGRDSTERKRVEQALRASEARWRAVVETAVDGIIVIDARGRVEAFNPAAERLFGYTEREIVGQNVALLMPSKYREEHDSYLARYLATGDPRIIGIGREVPGLRKDGTTFPIHLSVAELSIDGARKFTGIVHDLSERVRMEAQIREQSALTKLGEMATVIAHEVRNPLTGIRGAVQIIGGRLPSGSGDTAVVKEIIARIDALNELLQDMLLFARPPHPRLARVDVVPLLEIVVDLIGRDPALQQLRVEIAGTAPPILADAELLKIVVQNLILNSAHATQGTGIVRISVQGGPGGCVIAIADNGPGIPEEVRPKLFTPFFTTKARGTGLGLSTARRLMEAHGGAMAVDCPSAGGTVVTLRFPAADGPDLEDAGLHAAIG